MRTLRGRLILSHILPLLLVVPLVGVALIVLLETQVLLTEIADGLTEQADIIASAVFDRPELLNDPERAQAFVAGASVRMENQVMLIGPNGEIVASSSAVSQEPIDQPLDLEGFETAQSGEMSVNTIYSVTEQRVEVLVPITDANQQLIGIVSVTETLQGVASFFCSLALVDSGYSHFGTDPGYRYWLVPGHPVTTIYKPGVQGRSRNRSRTTHRPNSR